MTKDPVRSVPTVARRERRPKSRSVDAGAIALRVSPKEPAVKPNETEPKVSRDSFPRAEK